MNDDWNVERKAYLVTEIKRQTKDMKLAALRTAAAAFATGVGILGAITHGPGLLDAFIQNGSYVLVKLQGTAFSLSMASLLGGIGGGYMGIVDFIQNKKWRKSNEEALNELEHDERTR